MDTGRQSPLGAVIRCQPLSYAVLTYVVIAITVIALLFLMNATYTRKETVQGVLLPDKGVIKVRAPRAGTTGRVLVAENQFVQAGSPVISILGDAATGDGRSVNEEILGVIDSQLADNQLRIRIAATRRDADARRLESEISTLMDERRAITEQIAAQQSLTRILQRDVDRLAGMADKGFISETDYTAREESLISNNLELSGLEARLTSILGAINEKRLDLEVLPLVAREKLSGLTSERSTLLMKRIDYASRQSTTIRAPVSGTVTAIQAISGSTVNADLPLLSIVPSGGALEAQLFVPTRAIGFVRVGLEVRLLYDAYDYRHFGVHKGQVTEVSSATMLPGEIDRRTSNPGAGLSRAGTARE